MKKLMILAISAILVANVSAQEQKQACKKLSKEDLVEFDIRRFTNELLLSDEQAAKFAVTYREYADELDKLLRKNVEKKEFEPGKELTDKEIDAQAKQRFQNFKALADIQLKYYDKFRKDLSARQTEKVLQFKEPFRDKPCCGKPDCKKEGKQEGKPDGKKCVKRLDFRPDAPRPEAFEPGAPRPEK